MPIQKPSRLMCAEAAGHMILVSLIAKNCTILHIAEDIEGQLLAMGAPKAALSL